MATSKFSAETAINMLFMSSSDQSSESCDSSDDCVSMKYITIIRNNALYIYIYICLYQIISY